MNTYGNNCYGNAYELTGGHGRYDVTAGGQPTWPCAANQPAYQMGYRDGFVSGLGKVAGIAKIVIGVGGRFLGGSGPFK